MNESHKYSESDSSITYKQKDSGMEFSISFNLNTKTVDITQSIFIRNDEPMLEPMENEWVRYSAKYGHWQQVIPTLGREDIEFIHSKYIELFGDKE